MIDTAPNHTRALGEMSSNGLVLFFLVSLAALFIRTPAIVPPFVLALGLAFSLSWGRRGPVVIGRALLTVLPLAVFLLAVWVGIMHRAPDTSVFYGLGRAVPAWYGVAAIVSRLFLLALFTLAVVEAGADMPTSFIAGLILPVPAKVILLAASSVADVMRQGSRRAHTALIVAGILTPQVSLRNMRHGWLLVRTTWVAAVGLAVERLDTKWTYEDLPAAAPISRRQSPGFRWGDLFWVSAALTVLAATAATRG